MMAIFRVLVWLNGKRAGNKYKKVEADSAKDAAEKSYGGALYTEGSFGQIRAEVKPMGIGGPTIFYVR
jgi:hypothetical protein